MCAELLYPYIKHALGTLYPAYKTWKVLKRKDETKRRRWMIYWVSFAAFQTIEPIADITIIFITPFYFLIKILIITWLVYGTRILYESIINRELTKREKAIDRWLNKIYKLREEIIAFVWFELSNGLVRMFTTLMSGTCANVLHYESNDATIQYESSDNTVQYDSNDNMLQYESNDMM